jgi:hypothetical protein
MAMKPNKYGGLLITPEDKSQAMYQGLLNMGASMSQGYSDKPVSSAVRALLAEARRSAPAIRTASTRLNSRSLETLSIKACKRKWKRSR